MIQIPYNKFRYLYPPRPENAINSNSIPDFDNQMYGAQPKLNGDCVLVFTNGIETHVMNRHKQEYTKVKIQSSLHKLHRETITDSKDCVTNKWMVLVGEYMSKSKLNENGEVWNDKFVIFDIIAYDGYQLVGKTFKQRLELLDTLYGKDDVELLLDKKGNPTGTYKHKFMYTTNVPGVYRVKTFFDCFSALFKDLVKIDMFEGLVMKMLNFQLENGTTEKNNAAGMLKSRKQTKNYLY